jgi:hypothetical protein
VQVLTLLVFFASIFADRMEHELCEPLYNRVVETLVPQKIDATNLWIASESLNELVTVYYETNRLELVVPTQDRLISILKAEKALPPTTRSRFITSQVPKWKQEGETLVLEFNADLRSRTRATLPAKFIMEMTVKTKVLAPQEEPAVESSVEPSVEVTPEAVPEAATTEAPVEPTMATTEATVEATEAPVEAPVEPPVEATSEAVPEASTTEAPVEPIMEPTMEPTEEATPEETATEEATTMEPTMEATTEESIKDPEDAVLSNDQESKVEEISEEVSQEISKKNAEKKAIHFEEKDLILVSSQEFSNETSSFSMRTSGVSHLLESDYAIVEMRLWDSEEKKTLLGFHSQVALSKALNRQFQARFPKSS